MENFRITIGRQYGSGGKEVGRILAQKLGIPFYGKEELMKIAKDQPDYEEVRAFYEEQPVNSLLYAIAMEQGENRTGKVPFRKIRELCGSKSCILIGRCGSYIFREDPSCVKIFIYAAMAAAVMGVSTSCSDFLDVKPITNKQEPDFASQEGITQLLTGMYAKLHNTSYFEGTLTN